MFRALNVLCVLLAATSCSRDWSFENRQTGDGGAAGDSGDSGDSGALEDSGTSEAGVGDASTDSTCNACSPDCGAPSPTDSSAISGHVWSRQLTGPGLQRVLAVATNLSGDKLAFSGDFRESCALGSTVFQSSGLQDAFAMTLDPADGSTKLALHLGSAEDDDANAVGIDSGGNLLVAGSFGVTTDVVPNSRSLIAKFSPDGEVVWHIGTSGTHIGYSLAVDGMDRVALTGTFEGVLALPDGTLLQSEDPDAFVVLLKPDGMPLWARVFGGAEFQVGESIAFTPEGDIVVMGTATGKVDFGGGNLGETGTTSTFVVKLDADGDHVWSKTLGQTELYHAGTIVPDTQGNLVATTSFRGTLNVGGELFTSHGLEDALVVKLSPDGTHLWSRAFGAHYEDRMVGTVDESGRVFVAGFARGSMELGASSIVSANGSYDLLLAGWDPIGNLLEASFIGGPGEDNARAIASVPGGLVIGGLFEGCASFGGETFAASEDDGFIVRYAR